MMHRSSTIGVRIALLGVAVLVILLYAPLALAQPAIRSAVSPRQPRQSISAQAAPGGDIERGRGLFMGNLHLQNGGPPCMGCHNIARNGLLGGGALGPDLTNVSSRYSEAGLAATLVEPGPVMKPIFAEHPLTPQEQADLLAFMKASAGQPETNREGLVLGISLAGLLGAIGLIGFIFRRRLHGVRRPMVAEARLKQS